MGPNAKELFRLVEDFVDVIGFRMKDLRDAYQVTDNLGKPHHGLVPGLLAESLPYFPLICKIGNHHALLQPQSSLGLMISGALWDLRLRQGPGDLMPGTRSGI